MFFLPPLYWYGIHHHHWDGEQQTRQFDIRSTLSTTQQRPYFTRSYPREIKTQTATLRPFFVHFPQNSSSGLARWGIGTLQHICLLPAAEQRGQATPSFLSIWGSPSP
ncbi:hypothetical protein TNIN_21961 [Trichonephila inaurata madagascariensis]|uniref:Uncharacterized protein n=1 Tax=Trichonephila inaurata madagascariensis TaxID=2747483 RepID=A0A8X7CID4_9ARAC|nr:hypothetical protein TNIN_21961 [Trichonephila inaurata madagascariensis]